MTAHSVSAFAPSLGVACPPSDLGGCGADIGKRCFRRTWNNETLQWDYIEHKNCHPARRKTADEKRTAEVQALWVK